MENIIALITGYLFLGIIFSFLIDILIEYYFHPDDEDKLEFDWMMRIINILLWPYILGAFIRSLMGNYNIPEIGDVFYDDELGQCEVVDELPPEERKDEKVDN